MGRVNTSDTCREGCMSGWVCIKAMQTSAGFGANVATSVLITPSTGVMTLDLSCSVTRGVNSPVRFTCLRIPDQGEWAVGPTPQSSRGSPLIPRLSLGVQLLLTKHREGPEYRLENFFECF